jgi:hypothetical protein
MTRRWTRIVGATLALGLFAAACGESEGGGGGGTGNPIEHPTGADDLVLRWEYTGGFVPYEFNLSRIPEWSLYGDGRLIVQGPMIEIYPPPTPPSLLVTRLSEDGVQAILAAARDAGLMDGDATYDYPCIADAATTVFTTNADGRTSVVSAYALGDAMGGSCPDVDDEARQELADFQGKLGDLGSWLPQGSVGVEEPFTYEEMRIYAQPYQGEPELPQEPVAWPLAVGLDAFGEAAEPGAIQDIRCGVVSGTDLDAVLQTAEGTNELTPWTSDGAEHRLILRPLLPDERGC